MAQVEDKYKKDSHDAGGYDAYMRGTLNKSLLALSKSQKKLKNTFL